MRLAEFLETAERLKNERAAAGGVLEVVESTPPAQWPTLATHPALQTNAALERLGEEVRRRLDRNPREALALAELATTIADGLAETMYPAVTMAQIRAGAWKDRANALRFLGRYDEAFDAIARAEQILDKHIALGLDRAVVDLVKAYTLIDIGDFAKARALATACGAVFLAHGDLSRALQAGEMEGHALYEEHRYSDANMVFESFLKIAKALNDKEAEARLHNNAGYAAVELGDFRSANIHFSDAIARLTDLGDHMGATRTQRGAGLVLIARGQQESGIACLAAAQESFTRHTMIEEASLCGLSIAETLLSKGDAEQAHQVVQDIADQFRRTRSERQVVDALLKLEQSLATNDARVEQVRSVYALIETAQAAKSSM